MTPISEEMLRFIKGLPKAELHVHLESTAIPETLLKLAEKNNLDYPFKTLEEINKTFHSRTVGLKSFLDVHYKVFSVFKTRDDFRKVTYDARARIKGIGLDSYEQDNPPSKFVDVYEKAREQGYRLTAHCDVDQENSVKHIWECIDLLKKDRIDHGVNCIEDPKLVKALIERDIPLNVCPTWRTPYLGPRDLERIKKMFKLGLKVTLNTDDPAEFNSGFMNQLIVGAVEGSDYTKDDLVSFMRNAFDGSWLSKESKDKYIEELNKYTLQVG
jgi:adenosine deaminase